MEKTTVKQKFALIILSLVLTAVLLEIFLRIAGALVLYLQERHNHLSFDPHEYRILCLGESTTALGGEDSYPSLLEKMLNAQGQSKKFTVINKGLISTTSNYILAHLDRNLDTYRPQMVIVMMGINDKVYLKDLSKALWWENAKGFLQDLRVYKLVHLLYEHITHRISQVNLSQKGEDGAALDGQDSEHIEDFLKTVIINRIERSQEHLLTAAQYRKEARISEADQEQAFARQSVIDASMACVELARRYRLRGLYPQAQSVLEKATIINPNSTDIFQEWGELYLAQGRSRDSARFFQQALSLDPKNSDVLLGLAHALHQANSSEAFIVYAGYLEINPKDYWGTIELAQWLRQDKQYDPAERFLMQAIAIGPDFDQAYIDLGQVYDEQGQYQKEESFYLKAVSLHPGSQRICQALGQYYHRQGNEAASREYFQKAAGLSMPEYCPATLVNYSLLVDRILKRHIRVIVMQYPMRDIGILKDYLGQRDGIIYVENKDNFRQALTRQGYNYYFKDNFAYDFGHCRRAGNELIAHHLVGVILKNE